MFVYQRSPKDILYTVLIVPADPFERIKSFKTSQTYLSTVLVTDSQQQ